MGPPFQSEILVNTSKSYVASPILTVVSTTLKSHIPVWRFVRLMFAPGLLLGRQHLVLVLSGRRRAAIVAS